MAHQRAPEASELHPLGREGRFFVGLISFSHALQHVFTTVLPLSYPLAVREFGVSYATLGLVLTLAGVTGGLLQGAASLYERVPSRIVLGLQNLLSAVALAAAGLAPGFAFFGAARWAGSVVTSPQHPVGSAALTRRFPERRGTVLSWHTVGGSIGTLAVPLVASALIVAVGWRWTLALFSLPLLAGAALLWRFLPKEGDSKGATEPQAALWTTVLSRDSVMLIIASTVAAAGRGLGSLSAYVPAYLQDGLHLKQLVVGLIYTVLLIGSVLGPLAAGAMSDRIGRRRLAIAAYLLGAAALAGFALAGFSIWVLGAMAVLVGVFVYSESPLLQSLYSDATQRAAARGAFGIYFMVAYGAGSFWLVVLGAVIDRFGFRPAFFVMAASFLLAAFLVTLARAPAGRPNAPPADGQAQ